jgi:hypothetical protein
MKLYITKLAISILLVFLSCPLWAGEPVQMARMNVGIVGGGTAAAAAGNATDYKRDFETDSNTGWSETDAASKLNYYSTTYAHGGTHSMGITIDGDSIAAYNAYDMGSTYTTFSVCFWIYLSSYTGGSAREMALTQGVDMITRLYLNDVGTNQPGIAIRGTAFSSYIEIATGAWYRIEWKNVDQGNSTLSIYNVAGAQVGTTQTVTGNNSYGGVQTIWVGSNGGVDARYGMYIDDLGIDWTDGTSPLWPYS